MNICSPRHIYIYKYTYLKTLQQIKYFHVYQFNTLRPNNKMNIAHQKCFLPIKWPLHTKCFLPNRLIQSKRGLPRVKAGTQYSGTNWPIGLVKLKSIAISISKINTGPYWTSIGNMMDYTVPISWFVQLSWGHPHIIVVLIGPWNINQFTLLLLESAVQYFGYIILFQLSWLVRSRRGLPQ